MVKNVLIGFLLICSFELCAQAPNFIFHNISEQQGLSANFCNTLLKDSRGFLWVGTINGLSRYDGSHFYNFTSKNDSISLINSSVIDLCEDKEGNIWGATASGIFSYLPQINEFINYIPPTYDFARGIKNIICDHNGDIWATSEWNILKLNKHKNVFEEIGPLTTHKDSLRFYSVKQNGMVEDSSGKGIWFATRSGLHFYDIAEEKFESFKNSNHNQLFQRHNVGALSLSKTGKIWFFDNETKEIISFDSQSRKILDRIDLSSMISEAIGQTIYEDSNHILWFSTWNNKMLAIDYRKNIFTQIAHSENNPLSIPGDNFLAVWEDKNKNVWLGTAGGIGICNYSKNIYSIHPIVDKFENFKNTFLGAFSIDPRNNSWWIATEGEVSVINYFPESEEYKYFDFSKAIRNNDGQLPAPVFAVNFMDGKPYACTHNGIWELNEKMNFIVPNKNRSDSFAFEGINYFKEFEDAVWFSSPKGFIKLNKKTQQIDFLNLLIDTFPDGQKPNYSHLTIDQTGKKWFVPAFGWLANINDKNEINYKYYVKEKAREQFGYITSIDHDNSGNLWLASIGVGLYRYNINSEQIKLFDESDGIPKFINQVLVEKDDRIWISERNKFFIFNPVTNSISNYNIPLYENTLDYSNNLVKDAQGLVYSTLNKDIIKFIPDRLNLIPLTEAPTISMIKISGVEKLISNETTLVFKPDENSLEFYFGSFINQQIFPYSLEYKLVGFDEKWNTVNINSIAHYNNLDPGKYSFKVRAIAKNDLWQTAERMIVIKIQTPFYRAWWFLGAIVLVLISSVVLLYRYRLSQKEKFFILEGKANLLEKEKAMVMYDNLKQQLNPHFLFNSLTSLSGLIDTDKDLAGSFLHQMSGIYRYILKNSNNETVLLKHEIEFVQLYVNLQKTRFKNGLKVNVKVLEEFLHYRIAPVTLQNLIENAIKHNIIDKDSPLVIDIFVEDEYIIVKNNLQKKNMVETSNKKGLVQFVTLYKYLSQKPIIIEEQTEQFVIKIPLI